MFSEDLMQIVLHFKKEYNRPPIAYGNVIDIRCRPETHHPVFLVITEQERSLAPMTKTWWNIDEISQVIEE